MAESDSKELGQSTNIEASSHDQLVDASEQPFLDHIIELRSRILRAMVAVVLLFIPLMMLCFVVKDQPVRFGLSFAVVLASVGLYAKAQDGAQLHVGRNFSASRR